MSEGDRIHEEEPLPQGVRFILPRRSGPRLRGMRGVGMGLAVFGLIFALVPLAVLASSDDLFGTLFTIPFVFAGCGVSVLGYWMIAGTSSLEITRDRIRSIEHAGPFFFRRSRPRSGVERVLVREAPVRVNERRVEGIGVLAIEYGSGKPFYAGLVYPVESLQELAVDVIGALGLESDGPVEVEDVAIEEWEESPIPASLEPPAGTRLHLERNAVGLLIDVPPKGFTRTSVFLFLFAGFWLTITGIITFVGLFSEQAEFDEFPVLFMVPFWLIGIGVLLGGLHVARRRARIAVVNGNLLVQSSGLFGTKSREVPGDEVRAIDVGQTSYEINDRRLPLLEVTTRGKPVRMLDGWSSEEIGWVVAVLRDALRHS